MHCNEPAANHYQGEINPRPEFVLHESPPRRRVSPEFLWRTFFGKSFKNKSFALDNEF
jgi:hypothetical protein